MTNFDVIVAHTCLAEVKVVALPASLVYGDLWPDGACKDQLDSTGKDDRRTFTAVAPPATTIDQVLPKVLWWRCRLEMHTINGMGMIGNSRFMTSYAKRLVAWLAIVDLRVDGKCYEEISSV